MKPLNRIIVSIAFATSLCYISYFLFTKLLAKYEIHNTDRLTEILEKHTSYDLLFIGSSRTHFSVNPKIIDEKCNLNSFNAGLEGGDIYEFEMILKAYLENHKSPKYIVLNFDMHSFSGQPKIYNYPLYYPYYNSNITIKNYLKQNNYLTNIKEVVPFLQITDFDDNSKGYLIKSLMGKNEIMPNNFQYKGFVSNTDVTISSKDISFINVTLEISNEKIKCLDRIIVLCKKNGIKLIFTYAPEYRKIYQNSIKNKFQIFSIIQSRSDQNNILFLREDDLEICNNPNLFANVTHLNKQGAQVYSVSFATRLKKYL